MLFRFGLLMLLSLYAFGCESKSFLDPSGDSDINYVIEASNNESRHCLKTLQNADRPS